MPDTVRGQLQAQLAPYRVRHKNVRWTRPESWHLTLLFLGAVDPERIAELEALIDRVADDDGPYQATIGLGGGRLRGDRGVAWLSLGDGAGRLIDMATAMATGCPPEVTLGLPPRRTPSAHLTVVRKADERVIEALRTGAHGPIGVDWTIDRIALVRSHLEPGGARHQTLHESTL